MRGVGGAAAPQTFAKVDFLLFLLIDDDGERK